MCVPYIINHLHWTEASTPDNPDVMEANWKSRVNHVQDIHEDSTSAFPCCAHPCLEREALNNEQMKPGTTKLSWCSVYFAVLVPVHSSHKILRL